MVMCLKKKTVRRYGREENSGRQIGNESTSVMQQVCRRELVHSEKKVEQYMQLRVKNLEDWTGQLQSM